jgi:hypothetical protein
MTLGELLDELIEVDSATRARNDNYEIRRSRLLAYDGNMLTVRLSSKQPHDSATLAPSPAYSPAHWDAGPRLLPAPSLLIHPPEAPT